LVRPHRSTTYVNATLPTQQCGLSVCHTSEPCKNGWTDRDAVWDEDSGGPGNHALDGVDIPHGKGQFWGKWAPNVKYRDFLPWAVQKRLSRSICRLGCGLGWAEGSRSSIVFARWRQCQAQVQSYLLGGTNVPSLEGTLAPSGEYDWPVRLLWRYSLISNYSDHSLTNCSTCHKNYTNLVRHLLYNFQQPTSIELGITLWTLATATSSETSKPHILTKRQHSTLHSGATNGQADATKLNSFK